LNIDSKTKIAQLEDNIITLNKQLKSTTNSDNENLRLKSELNDLTEVLLNSAIGFSKNILPLPKTGTLNIYYRIEHVDGKRTLKRNKLMAGETFQSVDHFNSQPFIPKKTENAENPEKSVKCDKPSVVKKPVIDSKSASADKPAALYIPANIDKPSNSDKSLIGYKPVNSDKSENCEKYYNRGQSIGSSKNFSNRLFQCQKSGDMVLHTDQVCESNKENQRLIPNFRSPNPPD